MNMRLKEYLLVFVVERFLRHCCNLSLGSEVVRPAQEKFIRQSKDHKKDGPRQLLTFPHAPIRLSERLV